MNPLVFISIELFAIFILPVILLRFQIIPFKYRMHTLIAVTLATLTSNIWHKWPLLWIGINLERPFQYLLEYIVFIGVCGIMLHYIQKVRKKSMDQNLKYKSIVSSAAQEFMFRGFLFTMLGYFTVNPFILVFASATLFAIIHVIYLNKPLDLIVVFVGGIIIGTMYWMYTNLILMIIAHIVFNYIAVSNGYYTEDSSSKFADAKAAPAPK